MYNYPNNNNLKRYRRIAGYSQKELALILGIKNTSTICKWERGNAEPNIVQLFTLSVLLNTSPQELYSNKWNEKQQEVSLMKKTELQQKKQEKNKEIFYL